MKIKTFYIILMMLTLSATLPSCATMIGGASYYATVEVPNHPNAKIEYKGQLKGMGSAMIKVPRYHANKFAVTVKEMGCETQTRKFTKRSFRPGMLLASAVLFTGVINGMPIPWGIAVDNATGALWKPNVKEAGVSRRDMKHYTYTIDYTGCLDKENLKAQNN